MPKILVVDDEPRNRAVLRACLEQEGTTTIEAASGMEALMAVQQDHPDIVLLDVMMPGLDGFENSRRIKAIAGAPFLPVMLVTARGDRETRLRRLEAGADEVLTKPIDVDELAFRIRGLLA